MATVQALLAFMAAATILTLTPGVDTAMVLRSAASGGPKPAILAALGIALGCLVWGVAVSLGLGALLASSELAYTGVKWAGAAYLVYLGLKLVFHPRTTLGEVEPGTSPTRRWASLQQGLFTNLLNPKIGVFYVTFLPQFIPIGASVAGFSFVLASIHVLISLVWFAVLITATVPMGRVLRRPRIVQTLDRLTGGVFIAFGAKLALSR